MTKPKNGTFAAAILTARKVPVDYAELRLLALHLADAAARTRDPVQYRILVEKSLRCWQRSRGATS